MIENYEWKLVRLAEIFIGCLLLAIIVAMMITAGCVSSAKEVARGIMETPTPEPTLTPEPTPIPTPAPIPTPTPITTEGPEELHQRMLSTNGYAMREWVHWFREDVQGINGEGTKDLSTWATVYNYRALPYYTYRDFLTGSRALSRVRPDPGMIWLFVMVNIYSDGDDVRQYFPDQNQFVLHVQGETYYPEPMDYPERLIKELENTNNYGNITSVGPYGYLIVQEAGTGIRTAQKSQYIMGGRSNAEDGYIIFQIPKGTEAKDIEVHASFSNLAGQVWWQL